MTTGTEVPIALTIAEAAKVIGVKERTLADWRRTGEGPPHLRISSRCVRYLASDVRGWLEGRRRRSTSDTGEDS